MFYLAAGAALGPWGVGLLDVDALDERISSRAAPDCRPRCSRRVIGARSERIVHELFTAKALTAVGCALRCVRRVFSGRQLTFNVHFCAAPPPRLRRFGLLANKWRDVLKPQECAG